jgi:glutathione S-transferase
MYKLHDFARSGNAYKVRLLLTQLGIPFERIEVDLLGGETHSPAHLKLNPAGTVPVLVAADGSIYRDSNAILLSLAKGTPLLPRSDEDMVRVLEWLFFEQNQVAPNIGWPRYWISILDAEADYEHRIPPHHEAGRRALGLMQRHLTFSDFIVGDGYTIADIALYAYTHVAEEGGYDLDEFARVRAWLDRVQAQPGHIPITAA